VKPYGEGDRKGTECLLPSCLGLILEAGGKRRCSFARKSVVIIHHLKPSKCASSTGPTLGRGSQTHLNSPNSPGTLSSVIHSRIRIHSCGLKSHFYFIRSLSYPAVLRFQLPSLSHSTNYIRINPNSRGYNKAPSTPYPPHQAQILLLAVAHLSSPCLSPSQSISARSGRMESSVSITLSPFPTMGLPPTNKASPTQKTTSSFS
jgi:hypothetical protein